MTSLHFSTSLVNKYDIYLGFTTTGLTHWGRVTHICISELTTIGSDNGLSPGRRQAIIWNNAGILSIGLLGANFSEILIEILIFSFKKMHLKVSSAKCRPFCLGLNVLTALKVLMAQCLFQHQAMSNHHAELQWSIYIFSFNIRMYHKRCEHKGL